jgi:hypothetical protein
MDCWYGVAATQERFHSGFTTDGPKSEFGVKNVGGLLPNWLAALFWFAKIPTKFGMKNRVHRMS